MSMLLLLLLLFYSTSISSIFQDRFINRHHSHSNHSNDENDIVVENKKQGSLLWFNGWRPELKVGVNTTSYNFSLDQPGPKGYSTELSLLPGSTIHFKIDSLIYDSILVQSYEVLVFRLGYYNGTGARLIDTLYVNNTRRQPQCNFYKISRMVDCSNWHITVSYKLGIDLITGVYIALPVYTQYDNNNATKLHGSYIPFIVRDFDNRNGSSSNHNKKNNKPIVSDILFKTADLTWVAYNLYGNYSLYRGNGLYTFDSRAKVVSYNRPYNSRLSLPLGKYQNFLFGTEYAMIYWLEKLGYSVSYASCADVEMWGKTQHLSKYRTLLSVGHDEYWTQGLRDAIYGARENGVHLGFFAGNEFLWKVRWLEEIENDKANGLSPNDFKGDGFDIPTLLKESHRVIYCRKETIDSIPSAYHADWTGTFMDSRFGMKGDPSNSLSGQQNVVNSHRSDVMTVSAADAKLRLWRHTKLFDPKTYSNSSIYRTQPGILGYEWDLYVDDCNRPPGIIGFSHTKFDLNGYLLENYGANYKGNGTATHRVTMYRYFPTSSNNKKKLSSSSIVFAVGTIQWTWALSSKHDGAFMPVDYNIQQATINILADMKIQPHTLYNAKSDDGGHKLVKAHHSNDNQSPYSVIESPLSSYIVRPNSNLTIIGYARDRGGGKVAGVEVSFDNGLTWKVATGRYKWELIVSTDSNGIPINYCSNNTIIIIDSNTGFKKINIISRAIDDSGWLEEIHHNSNTNNNTSSNFTMADKFLQTKRNFLRLKVA